MFRFVMMALVVTLVSMGTASSQTAAASEVVSYRCEKWTVRHEHDAKQADQIVETLKKLKVEVEKHDHNGHIDIKYRCPKWLSHKTTTHENAHKLQNWLNALKFETKHEH
ncbi:hypothetical protein [Allorhodopirellula solitaria]|uniref:Uncharacterized protein n=1 Tax=Allorhodopirellula solitaria TaxID=2527987 RepID=A0A5C5WNH1_9BACT|nr:hypothetical protein [Allorhodopirellula solitaria]TWT52374.1 hypothetical protein CA85_50280 [Allorhodopirellula solitaria]